MDTPPVEFAAPIADELVSSFARCVFSGVAARTSFTSFGAAHEAELADGRDDDDDSGLRDVSALVCHNATAWALRPARTIRAATITTLFMPVAPLELTSPPTSAVTSEDAAVRAASIIDASVAAGISPPAPQPFAAAAAAPNFAFPSYAVIAAAVAGPSCFGAVLTSGVDLRDLMRQLEHATTAAFHAAAEAEARYDGTGGFSDEEESEEQAAAPTAAANATEEDGDAATSATSDERQVALDGTHPADQPAPQQADQDGNGDGRAPEVVMDAATLLLRRKARRMLGATAGLGFLARALQALHAHGRSLAAWASSGIRFCAWHLRDTPFAASTDQAGLGPDERAATGVDAGATTALDGMDPERDISAAEMPLCFIEALIAVIEVWVAEAPLVPTAPPGAAARPYSRAVATWFLWRLFQAYGLLRSLPDPTTPIAAEARSALLVRCAAALHRAALHRSRAMMPPTRPGDAKSVSTAAVMLDPTRMDEALRLLGVEWGVAGLIQLSAASPAEGASDPSSLEAADAASSRGQAAAARQRRGKMRANLRQFLRSPAIGLHCACGGGDTGFHHPAAAVAAGLDETESATAAQPSATSASNGGGGLASTAAHVDRSKRIAMARAAVAAAWKDRDDASRRRPMFLASSDDSDGIPTDGGGGSDGDDGDVGVDPAAVELGCGSSEYLIGFVPRQPLHGPLACCGWVAWVLSVLASPQSSIDAGSVTLGERDLLLLFGPLSTALGSQDVLVFVAALSCLELALARTPRYSIHGERLPASFASALASLRSGGGGSSSDEWDVKPDSVDAATWERQRAHALLHDGLLDGFRARRTALGEAVTTILQSLAMRASLCGRPGAGHLAPLQARTVAALRETVQRCDEATRFKLFFSLLLLCQDDATAASLITGLQSAVVDDLQTLARASAPTDAASRAATLATLTHRSPFLDGALMMCAVAVVASAWTGAPLAPSSEPQSTSGGTPDAGALGSSVRAQVLSALRQDSLLSLIRFVSWFHGLGRQADRGLGISWYREVAGHGSSSAARDARAWSLRLAADSLNRCLVRPAEAVVTWCRQREEQNKKEAREGPGQSIFGGIRPMGPLQLFQFEQAVAATSNVLKQL